MKLLVHVPRPPWIPEALWRDVSIEVELNFCGNESCPHGQPLLARKLFCDARCRQAYHNQRYKERAALNPINN